MILNTALAIFGVGCGGGVIAEVLHWWNLKEKPQLPQYAKSVLYWALTGLMVLSGGFLSWLYFGQHAEAIVAFHVGLSAPIILQKLATSVPAAPGARSLMSPQATIRSFFTW